MGEWCSRQIIHTEDIVDTPEIASFRVRCAIEFGRTSSKPLGKGAEASFNALFNETIGAALRTGSRLTPMAEAWVIRYVGQAGRLAFALAGDSEFIVGPMIEQATANVIEKARRVEARIAS